MHASVHVHVMNVCLYSSDPSHSLSPLVHVLQYSKLSTDLHDRSFFLCFSFFIITPRENVKLKVLRHFF